MFREWQIIFQYCKNFQYCEKKGTSRTGVRGVASSGRKCSNAADFVAYATIAHRSVESPVTSVTGSWSPLFSWLMVPFLQIGVDGLIAGRIILLLSGMIYIWAIHRIA